MTRKFLLNHLRETVILSPNYHLDKVIIVNQKDYGKLFDSKPSYIKEKDKQFYYKDILIVWE